MGPEIVYLILCDDVTTAPANFLRVDVHGLITRVRSTGAPPFPLVQPVFCVLVILTDCQGAGEVSLRIVQAATGRVVFRNQPRLVRFSGALQDAVGITFRIRNCSFPAEGLYWVEFVFSSTVLARQRLSLSP